MKPATRKHRGAVRPVAGRQEILDAARSIGIRAGWKAVTIRAVAQQLGYSSPLLYEHFRDKQELLTELAIDGQNSLADALMSDLPGDPYDALLSMVDRFWSFMLENEQVYRLMNGMDGVAIDRERVRAFSQRRFENAIAILQAWLITALGSDSGAAPLFDDLWAVLHGMAALYLDRSAPFDRSRARACVERLLIGIRRPHPDPIHKNGSQTEVVGGSVADTKTVIKEAYSAFNRRDIDRALALMTQDVSWPKASEGGRILGKEQIRAYWTRQWREFDPHVEPLAISEEADGKARVRVHQLVKNLQGDILSDGEVLHVFTMNNGLIEAMDLGDQADLSSGPSAAFAHRTPGPRKT